MSQQVIPPVLERYEMKYTIPETLVEPISRFAEAYCYLDKYSEMQPDKFYRINNLYLDSPNFLFLRSRIHNSEKRFNMRVRTYGDHPKPPYFMEVKQKVGETIRKYRGRVSDVEWRDGYFLQDDSNWEEGADTEASNRSLFKRLALTYGVEPKILTQYRRKAYISHCEDYARVTFDIGLRYMQETTYNLLPREEKMTSYDHELNFDPGCSVILELKCYTSYVPHWMLDMVRMFNLDRRGFSKYGTGVAEVLNLREYDDSLRESAVLRR